jgi:signal transduction histidine kinase
VDEAGAVPLLVPRLGRRRLIALDGALGVAHAVVLVPITLSTSPSAFRAPVWAVTAIAAMIGLPLVARRRWPVAVFAIILALSGLLLGLGGSPGAFVAAAGALYMVAATRPRPRWEPTRAIAAASLAGLFGLGVAVRTADWITIAALGLVAMGAAWTLGRVVRERRVQAAGDARRLAAQAVMEERLRIARELHDVVAHSMSVIAVEAGVGSHVAAVRPDAAGRALAAIETVSRGALAEMRRLLGVLRSEDDAGGELAPSPTLADVSSLCRTAAAAGVVVELDVRVGGELPEGVQLTAYRIVQEALTNVIRHAAPARCRVRVEADASRLGIEVVDDGPGRRVLPGGGKQVPGHGLVGMRERVAMYGGALSAAPRPEGGFAVRATLPLEGAP